MDSYRKVILVISVITLLALVALFYLLFIKTDTPPATTTTPPSQTEVEKQATAEPEQPSRQPLNLPEGITLDSSDEFVRGILQPCADHRLAREALQTEGLIRTISAAIENIASGQTPLAHIPFWQPEAAFSVLETDSGDIIDPASFKRFEPLVELARSLDCPRLPEVYATLKPLLDEATKDLGYPEGNFTILLQAAADVILATPVTGPKIYVEKAVVSYTFRDSDLENLLPVQKQLLRMGPGHIRTIQRVVDRAVTRLLHRAVPAGKAPPAAR